MLNNPLSYTDPTGYWSFKKNVLQQIPGSVASVINIVLSIYYPPAAAIFSGMYASANGATSGQVIFSMTTSFIGGELGAKVAAARVFTREFTKTLIQGVVSGAFTGYASAKVYGGSISDGILKGALIGAFTAAVAYKINKWLSRSVTKMSRSINEEAIARKLVGVDNYVDKADLDVNDTEHQIQRLKRLCKATREEFFHGKIPDEHELEFRIVEKLSHESHFMETTPDGKTILVLRGNLILSDDTLAWALGHELVHVREIVVFGMKQNTPEHWQNEIDAYDWELEHAKDFGIELKEKDINDIKDLQLLYKQRIYLEKIKQNMRNY